MDFVEQVKSQIDIVRVVGDYVRLKRQGAGERYVGLCPFHTEKTPSFSVHAGHGFYKCFGCGAGGDAIKFVMEMEGFTFLEAVKALAERNGIPLPRNANYSDEDAKRRTDLYRLNELAQDLFTRNLWSPAGESARAYLSRRGITDAQAKDFGLGFAAGGGSELVRLLERQRVDKALLDSSGLVKPRANGDGYYDTFRGRLTFPIHNESGKLVAFGARVLDPEEQPKYLNSPETDIYKKRTVLYQFHRAKESMRKQGRAVLVEGYMDVLGAWAAGVHEAVASCGTSLSAEHVRNIRRHTDVVVVNFDPDRAGENATERSIQVLLDEGVDVRVLQLPGGLDPDEFVQQHGADAYQQAIANARGYFLWLADRAKARFDTASTAGRVKALEFLLPAIQRVNDRLRRSALADEVTSYLGLERSMVLDKFRSAAVARKDGPLRVEAPQASHLEHILISCLVNLPEVAAEILPFLNGLDGWRKLPSAPVLDAILRAWKAGEDLRFGFIEPRLAEADKDILSRMLLDEEVHKESHTRDQAIACLRKLDLIQIADFRRELKRRVREAEQQGDFEEALRLSHELTTLDAQRPLS
ncbi:MAG: DNA primase [Bryobacterales bacterium]|jgi:DNA primase|nr:DNA primase [Bryobacterales bacterium]